MVSSRFGNEVLERLVDPLIGGINAGDANRLSASAVTPQIDAVARRSRSLSLGLRAERKANPPDPSAPVFFTVRGGMERLINGLVEALESASPPVEVLLNSTVEGVEVDSSGVTLLAGRDPRRIAADGAVLACPAGAAASALAPLAPSVAATLRDIEYASVALVTLAFPDSAMGRDLDASGLLVPKPEQRTVTACSWASSKWSHWRSPGQTIIRASAGRDGDDRALNLDDDELVAAVLADLTRLMDVRGDPTEVRVSRWPHSFPQYRPGHLTRVDEVERTLAADLPQIVVTGAAHRGLGIPACIRQGRGAARTLLARLHTDAARVKMGHMDRRTFLVAGAGALVAAACGGRSGVDDDPSARGPGDRQPDDRPSDNCVDQRRPHRRPRRQRSLRRRHPRRPPPPSRPPPRTPRNAHAPEPEVRIGTIEIPKVGLNHVMYEGITLTTLNKGPGHWPGTALPSQDGNVVVAGHRVTHSRPFRNIDQMGPGDEVIFTIGSGRHTYTFVRNEIVPPTGMHIVQQTPAKTATIFACHPPGSARFRFVVHLSYVGTVTV